MRIISYLDKTNVLHSLFVLDPTSHANDFPKMLSDTWHLRLKCETLKGWLQAQVCIWGSSTVGLGIKTQSGGKDVYPDQHCEGERTGQKEVKLGHRSPWPGTLQGMLFSHIPY